MERRKARRYRLHAPAIFRWTDTSGISRQRGGFTRDISTTGVFILTDSLPEVNTALRLEVLLGSFAAAGFKTLRLKADGRVTRVARGHEEPGFAATTDFSPLQQYLSERGIG